MFYSKSKNSFYTTDIHGDNIPVDAVAITKEKHNELMAAQSNGKQITSDANGSPTAIEPPDRSPDQRIPSTITARQGEQQLILADLDEQVDAAIDAIADTKQRKLTRAWYNRATTWDRNSAEFIKLGEALGLTPEQMDDHFKAASEL